MLAIIAMSAPEINMYARKTPPAKKPGPDNVPSQASVSDDTSRFSGPRAGKVDLFRTSVALQQLQTFQISNSLYRPDLPEQFIVVLFSGRFQGHNVRTNAILQRAFLLHLDTLDLQLQITDGAHECPQIGRSCQLNINLQKSGIPVHLPNRISHTLYPPPGGKSDVPAPFSPSGEYHSASRHRRWRSSSNSEPSC